MNPFAKFFCGLLLCCFAAFAQATAKAKTPPFSTSPEVQAFIAEMHAQHGFDPGAFGRVHRILLANDVLPAAGSGWFGLGRLRGRRADEENDQQEK